VWWFDFIILNSNILPLSSHRTYEKKFLLFNFSTSGLEK
jgi:hypothetical protein